MAQLVRPRAYGEPIHEDAPGFDPTEHRDLIEEVNDVLEITLADVNAMTGGVLTQVDNAPATESLLKRLPLGGVNQSNFSESYYRHLTPTQEAILAGLEARGAQTSSWVAVVFNAATQALVATGDVAAPGAGSKSRFQSPVVLAEGVGYLIGMVAISAKIKDMNDMGANSFAGFTMLQNTYFIAGNTVKYPTVNFDHANAIPYDLLLMVSPDGSSVLGLGSQYKTSPPQGTRLPTSGQVVSVVDLGGQVRAQALMRNGDGWSFTPRDPINPQPGSLRAELDALKTRVLALENA